MKGRWRGPGGRGTVLRDLTKSMETQRERRMIKQKISIDDYLEVMNDSV